MSVKYKPDSYYEGLIKDYQDVEPCPGIVIERLREEAGMSKSRLAKLIGKSGSTFHDWTTGRMPRDMNAIRKIANVFNKSVEYILFGEKQDYEKALEELNAKKMEELDQTVNVLSQCDLFIDTDNYYQQAKAIKDAFTAGELTATQAQSKINKITEKVVEVKSDK